MNVFKRLIKHLTGSVYHNKMIVYKKGTKTALVNLPRLKIHSKSLGINLFIGDFKMTQDGWVNCFVNYYDTKTNTYTITIKQGVEETFARVPIGCIMFMEGE